MRLVKFLILGVFMGALASPALAQDTTTGDPLQPVPPSGFRFGGLFGQNTLTSDPGDGGQNGFGFAASISYKIQDAVALDLRYLIANHSETDHREISFGGDYYFGNFEQAFPYASLGIALLNNNLRKFSRNGDAAGAYIGVGVEYDIYPTLRLGPEFRYMKAFTAQANLSGREINSVADSYALMIRLLYSLPGN